MSWEGSGDAIGCYLGADLERADGDPILEVLVNEVIEGRRSGTTNLYGLAAADYYVATNSSCSSWSFTFRPS